MLASESIFDRQKWGKSLHLRVHFPRCLQKLPSRAKARRLVLNQVPDPDAWGIVTWVIIYCFLGSITGVRSGEGFKHTNQNMKWGILIRPVSLTVGLYAFPSESNLEWKKQRWMHHTTKPQNLPQLSESKSNILWQKQTYRTMKQIKSPDTRTTLQKTQLRVLK